MSDTPIREGDTAIGRAGGAMPDPDGSTTIAICFLAALLEGYDLQSTGVVASRLAHALHLDAGMLGLIFSIGTLGLLPGAMVGGRLADRFGRKRLLVASMVLFGAFSLLTAIATSPAMLAVARLLTGIGLGAALPNLIALTAEAALPARRSGAISIMYAGLPLGGVGAAAAGLIAGGPEGWRTVFIVGGALPILLVPLVLFALPVSQIFAAQADTEVGGVRMPYAQTLFGGGRLPVTLLLWTSYFFTLLVVYLLLNWLPTLLAGRGLTRAQAGETQIIFNVGAAVGSLVFGAMMDRTARWLCVVTMYAGVLAGLVGLIAAATLVQTLAAGFCAGFFVIGGQLVLYALAPGFYATAMRGAGVGAAVGVGRLGAIAGPALAGAILARGHGATTVLVALLPGLLVAALAALSLVRRGEPARG